MTSLSLGFFICKVGVMIPPVVRTTRGPVSEASRTMPGTGFPGVRNKTKAWRGSGWVLILGGSLSPLSLGFPSCKQRAPGPFSSCHRARHSALALASLRPLESGSPGRETEAPAGGAVYPEHWLSLLLVCRDGTCGDLLPPRAVPIPGDLPPFCSSSWQSPASGPISPGGAAPLLSPRLSFCSSQMGAM